MTVEQDTKAKEPRWLYPVVYLLFVVISFLPPYTEQPYTNRDIQDLIISVLIASTKPYGHLGPIFHVATLLLVLLIGLFGERMGRVLAAYMGLNYLVLAFIPTMATTEEWGFAIHTGALVACLILGIAWIVVAIRGDLKPSFKGVAPMRYLFLPLALLAFWTPTNVELQPHFDPLLLLTSPDYGLYFCMTTPVFLFLLTLFYPRVNFFAFRITAFNGLLYGFINMMHFFYPGRWWMGVLHLPLLLISLYALLLPRLTTLGRQAVRSAGESPDRRR